MALDGILINSLTHELNHLLTTGRVDKIHQPDKNTVIISIRKPNKSFKLLVSNHPQTTRFHITDKTRSNPSTPPLFCMVLRKHLEGARLLEIKQDGLERVVSFTFEIIDELGEKAKRVLIGEFMGKHSNIILYNPETGLIIDSIKRLTTSTTSYREVLPGYEYVSPPPQNKKLPTDLSEQDLIKAFLDLSPETTITKALINTISGFSPQTAREISIRSNLDPNTGLEFLGQYEYSKLFQSITWLKEILDTHNFKPTIVFDNDIPIAFAPFELNQFASSEQRTLPSMSNLLETYIGQKEDKNVLSQKVLDLQKIVKRELDRCGKKLNLQYEKISDGKVCEKYKIWGELLTANLYQIKQGDKAIVPNFYSEQQELIEIPLDPHLTPNENAQKYFNKYTKAKIGAEKSKEQADIVNKEVDYLETIAHSLQKADNLIDLQEIRIEMEEESYLKKKISKKKEKAFKQNAPLSLIIDDFQVYFGKNNKQNDYVTFKIGRSLDTWLHTKDIPGSHVIIKNPENKEIPAHVLETSAEIAAYFSKARNSSQVPVDYTLVKHVKKPNGVKPGMVIYENQKTIYITPNEENINKLLEKRLD
ncbi:Predicted component of the ribosome quality control (RQC) complex, YloA/Tae2 family, contains fibronectin-binding (FbpA) and DUF814 domains [Desulfonispora thiosulfatigenes DSM 11270]|uniref:Rqc2 homolog RqcH n=1 Tax=Desulfonispora thiosulfatigenes DSM 11270 TaxID=656914 RepID=A0A1W1VJ50_DESTI|nr:NFACT RNA binding domain-containing protein [Desulfonispora thiosulfatigenes]SMB93303.1 Predicted component of the ribosome quality control (RQC) complex, YloA/Tae2 family, contains fibronectin-binding (FbpA) and DUF814 domains [Desulfonispora thiosulfatigenes DSM 11270]